MRLRLTIILLLLNGGLFYFLYVLEKKPLKKPPGFGMVLPEGVVDASEKLQIEGWDSTRNWILEKEGGDWWITSPVLWRANFFAVNRIFNQLQFLEKETSFSVRDIRKAGQTLEDYGLLKPQAILTLYHQGERTRIKIGESTTVGNRLYILSPDETQVDVVNRELLNSITINLENLRSREVFTIPLFEVRSLVVKLNDLPIRLLHQGEGWIFETPIQTLADTDRVEFAINQLTALRLFDFPNPDPAGQGLENPSMRLTLEGNNRRETILLGSRTPNNPTTPQYYAKLDNNPTVFTVPTAPFEDFMAAQEKLREKRFVHLERDRLTEIDIAVGDQSVKLQKLEKGGWQVPKKNADGSLVAWPADPKLMKAVIDALLNLSAVNFLTDSPSATDLEEYGLNDPQRRITLFRGSEKNTLLLGDLESSRKRLYAKMEELPFVYQIEQNDILGLLQSRALYYRLRILEEQPPAAFIEGLSLTELETGSTLLSLQKSPEEKEGKPSLGELFSGDFDTLPEGDKLPARTIIQYLRKFTVKSYLGEGFSKNFEQGDRSLPWKLRLQATINLPGGERGRLRILNFFFTERLGGTTQIGGSPELDLTFELDQELIDALSHFAFLRTPPKAEKANPKPAPVRDEEKEKNSGIQSPASPGDIRGISG